MFKLYAQKKKVTKKEGEPFCSKTSLLPTSELV